MADRLTYRFGPLERRGVLGPLRAGQAILIMLGAVTAVVVLDTWPTARGAVLSTVLFATCAGIGMTRCGGRALDEWSPVIAAFGWRTATSRRRFRSAAPTRGRRLGARGGEEPRTADVPLPLRGVRILAAQHRGAAVGLLATSGGRYLTAVLACRAGTFALLEPEAQGRRLTRWGEILAGAAGTPIRRLQWVERTAPARGDELARWVHSQRDPTVPLRGTAMIESYLELIGTSARVAHEHEILLAVQIDARRVRERRIDSPATAVLEQADRVARGLEAAQVGVMGALSPGQLAQVLRTAFDPYSRSELAALEAVDEDRGGLSEAGAWPLGAHEAWEHYRSDGALHATFWIGAWPRMEVSPLFMDSLLGRSSSVRTVGVTFEPLPLDRSTRQAEAAITRDLADRDLRRRFGQSHTARQRQVEEAALRREAELAAGHGEVRFAGFITVSGRDDEELRRATAEVSEHAARARLGLHRMYGQQAAAFTFTLPLCRGLR